MDAVKHEVREESHQIQKLKCLSSRLVAVFADVLCRVWICSWSSSDRRYSNYIWVINSIAYEGVPYNKDLTVDWPLRHQLGSYGPKGYVLLHVFARTILSNCCIISSFKKLQLDMCRTDGIMLFDIYLAMITNWRDGLFVIEKLWTNSIYPTAKQ